MFNLATMLEDCARRLPERDAVVLGSTRLSYAAVDAAANRVANLLTERGIRPDDRVALSCPNVPYFPIAYYGILKTGAVVVPLDVSLKAREIAHHLADSGAKAYFCFEGSAEDPLGAEGWIGSQCVATCEHFFLMTADPTAPARIKDVVTLGAAMAAASPHFATVAIAPTDTR